jgi:uncharacterized protein YlxW (UPF0749 family)
VPKQTSPALVLVLALLGFGIVTAAQSASATRKAEQPGKDRLIALIQQRRAQIDDLDTAVGELRGQLNDEQRRVSRANHTVADTTRVQSTLAAQAGTSPVRGSGLRVKVSDADSIPDDATEAEAYRISDLDLQLLVNALWGAGAEAIAVNGNRVVATTSIREAGETIVVNFRPLSPPYRIDAIGADRARFGASGIAGQMRHWHRLFGLGFSTQRVDEMLVPAFAGRVGIDVATPKEAA